MGDRDFRHNLVVADFLALQSGEMMNNLCYEKIKILPLSIFI